MADIRVFSYLPNPRLAKATIAGRINGVDVEIRGAQPGELKQWLWDFDAHPMTDDERDDQSTLRTAKKGFSGGLHKTDAFLQAHPFGNVPAAFSGDGKVGIFESNSIMRAVARLGQDRAPLYGRNPFEASRIDSFLDVSLAFAAESQKYLFSFGDLDQLAPAHKSMTAAFDSYLLGMDQALSNGPFLAGDQLTLADITFAAEITLFALERHEDNKLGKVNATSIFKTVALDCTRARTHFLTLLEHPAFAPDLQPYFEQMTMKKLFA